MTHYSISMWHYYNHMSFWDIFMFTGVPSDPDYDFFREHFTSNRKSGWSHTHAQAKSTEDFRGLSRWVYKFTTQLRKVSQGHSKAWTGLNFRKELAV